MIKFQIKRSPGGKHVAQAVEDGKILAVSKQAHTNGEAAIKDAQQVLVELLTSQGDSILYAPAKWDHTN